MAVSMLAGAAAGLASAYMQQQFTKENADRDAEIQRGMQAQNFMYADEMQRRAPVNTKLGMMAAGLNPNSMNTNSSAGSVTSAPLGNHAAPDVNFSQDNNLMSDSRLKNAEAEKLELENEQTKAENESSYENYVKQIESLSSAYRQRNWNEQADMLDAELGALYELKRNDQLNWNVGNLRGAVNAFATTQALQERFSNTLDQLLKTETNYKMLINGSSFSLSKMPKLQREMLEKQISTQMATTSLLISQKTLTDEQRNELLMMQDKIGAEIAQLEEQGKLTKAQADQIRNADWKTLLDNGEFKKAMIAQADEKTKIILNQLGPLAGAVVNAKTGGKIAQSMAERKKVIYHEFEKPDGHYNGHAPMKRSMLGDGVPDDNYNDD